MALSDIADWWDKQKKDSNRILEEWVQENPQWWAIGLATATSTAMELGAGMVDALRLGEGVAEGGLKGFAKDSLRLLALLGPMAKAGGMIGRFAHTQAIRLAVTTKGVTGPCTFTAVNNALSITRGGGRSLFITAKDAAQALGRPLAGTAKIGGRYKIAAWIDDLIPFLTKQGVRLQRLGTAKSVEDVVNMAGTRNGVVVFAIEWIDAAGKLQKHSMIAVRTLAGVRFADYGGRFISSLGELAGRGGIWVAKGGYNIASTATKGSAVLFEGMEFIGALEQYGAELFKGGMLLLEGMHALETPDGVDLAFEVATAAVIDTPAHDLDVVKGSFQAFKARKKGRAVITLPPARAGFRRRSPPKACLLTGVQYRLNAAGFGAGPVDGIYGPKTKRAIREFQLTYRLSADGIPGPLTQAKLVEVCGY